MTQTHPPFIAGRQALQTKLMAGLDAAWAILDGSDAPAAIRRARDKARACGELAAVARKVAAMTGPVRGKATAEAAPTLAMPTDVPAPASIPVVAQVEQARRAIDKLRGGRRGRP